MAWTFNKHYRVHLTAAALIGAVILVASTPLPTVAKINDALWLSLAPAPAAKGPVCEQHQSSQPAPERKSSGWSGRPEGSAKETVGGYGSRSQSSKPQSASSRGGGTGSGRWGGKSRRIPEFESEHRAVPVRKYFLKGPALSDQAEAFLLHPDGSHEQIDLTAASQKGVSFKTPLKDDAFHGANNLYVIDRQVIDGVLTVRVAKWITIHHSCGWGHDYRNTQERIAPLSLASVPLEIVIDNLWDGNFHVRTHSGDTLKVQVLTHGSPVKDAEVTVTTAKKWSLRSKTDENGIAPVQMIRDYYPSAWNVFKRTKRGRMTITAQYRAEQSGEFQGQSYSRVHYITTLPWKYTPASADYASYAFGLAMGTLSFTVAGVGIYAFRARRKRPYQRITLD